VYSLAIQASKLSEINPLSFFRLIATNDIKIEKEGHGHDSDNTRKIKEIT